MAHARPGGRKGRPYVPTRECSRADDCHPGGRKGRPDEDASAISFRMSGRGSSPPAMISRGGTCPAGRPQGPPLRPDAGMFTRRRLSPGRPQGPPRRRRECDLLPDVGAGLVPARDDFARWHMPGRAAARAAPTSRRGNVHAQTLSPGGHKGRRRRRECDLLPDVGRDSSPLAMISRGGARSAPTRARGPPRRRHECDLLPDVGAGLVPARAPFACHPEVCRRKCQRLVAMS